MGAAVQLRILGPFEVRLDGGEPLALGGLRQRALLAVLALRANEVVLTDVLIEQLWGDHAPAKPVHTVQVFVSRLRGALGTAGDRLVTQPSGYQLRVEPDEVDGARCRALLDDARGALRAGDAARAQALLRDASALWRGPPLAEFTYEPFAQAEIARLDELRLACREELIEAQLALGGHAEVTSELEALVREQPFRERARAQLMLALYRSGRQADALDAYQQARRMLVDELALEPSPALKELEQRILRQDSSLSAPSVAPSPAPRPAAPPERAAAPPQSVQTAGPEEDTVVRKTVSVLVARIDLTARLDPETARRRLAEARSEARQIVAEHGGSFLPRFGGEILGVFGLPLTSEDDALRALRAADELRTRIAAGKKPGESAELSIRAFVDTGEVVAQDPGDVSGEPLTTALELVYAAQASEVLLGDATRRLASTAIGAEPALEGSAWRLMELMTAPALRPARGPMVGRERELAEARTAFERAARTGAAHLFTVAGEAGIGKSRLARELLDDVQRQATVLIARCLSYGDASAFWPLREPVAQAAAGESREAIRSLLGDTHDADLIADVVAATLGLAPAGDFGDAVRWAFRRLFEVLAAGRPLVLVIEDAHWARPPLLDLIDDLVDWLVAPVLVLCIARPELLDPSPDPHAADERRPRWRGGDERIKSVVLLPLTDEESLQLLARHPAASELTEADRIAIVDTAEGNPLFVEQLLAMRTEDPSWGEDVGIPATIQTLLSARLDRLGPGERALVNRAAVIGREFSSRAVVELLPAEARPSAPQHLRTLLRRGLVHPGPAPAPGEEQLRFHHVLIREVAYRSIAKSLRSELHERFGSWLDAYPGSSPEFVGFHLERAFVYRHEVGRLDEDLVELGTRAAESLTTAGRRALSRGDANAAVELLGRGRDVCETARLSRPDLLLELGNALTERGEYHEAEGVLNVSLEQARDAGERVVGARASIELSYLGTFLGPGAQVEAIQAVADRTMAVFQDVHDEAGLARARLHLAEVHWTRGEFGSTEHELELALEHAERAEARRDLSRILTMLACVVVMGPRPVEDAIAACETIRGRAGEDLRLIAFAETMLAVLEAMSGRVGEARDRWRATRLRLEELGLEVRLALLSMYRAFIELVATNPEDIEPELGQAYAVVERTGEQGHLATIAALRARLLYMQGRYEECEFYCQVSRTKATDDDVVSKILWQGTWGRLCARSGKVQRADEGVHGAVSLAERTDSPLLRMEALRDRAAVHRLQNDNELAIHDLESAIAVCREKGMHAPALALTANRRSVSGDPALSVASRGQKRR